MHIARFVMRKIFTCATDMSYFLWFGGTDVLLLYCNKVPGFSRFEIARFRWLMRRFTVLKTYCYINRERLRRFLVDFGFAEDKIFLREIPHQELYIEKVKHDGFNVLFYLPTNKGYKNRKYVDWMYGSEYLEALKHIALGVNWVIADGSLDMTDVYPTVDCYVKINKMPHNDLNKTGRECLDNNIPAKAFDVWRDDFDIHEIWEWIDEAKSRRVH